MGSIHSAVCGSKPWLRFSRCCSCVGKKSTHVSHSLPPRLPAHQRTKRHKDKKTQEHMFRRTNGRDGHRRSRRRGRGGGRRATSSSSVLMNCNKPHPAAPSFQQAQHRFVAVSPPPQPPGGLPSTPTHYRAYPALRRRLYLSTPNLTI